MGLHSPRLAVPLPDDVNSQSLQERFSPASVCFGCGPANALGLRIRSFEEGEAVVAHWRAALHHQAFPGALKGGIVGALLDCHSNSGRCHFPSPRERNVESLYPQEALELPRRLAQ